MHPALVLAATDLNSTGIVAWLVKNIVPVFIVIVGLSVLSQFKSGRASKVAQQVGIMLLGCAIIAGGATWYAFGDTISKTLLA